MGGWQGTCQCLYSSNATLELNLHHQLVVIEDICILKSKFAQLSRVVKLAHDSIGHLSTREVKGSAFGHAASLHNASWSMQVFCYTKTGFTVHILENGKWALPIIRVLWKRK